MLHTTLHGKSRLGRNTSGPRFPYRLAVLGGSLLICFVTLGADSVWRTKPAAEWTADDAQQVLTSSPWVRVIRGGVARRQTEDELRTGGQLGQPQGLGYDNVDPKGSGYKPSGNIFTGKGGDDRSARSLPSSLPLNLRWESALPVRLAELKSHRSEAAALEGDGYQIAVFGIPRPDKTTDQAHLADPLKNQAFLRRDGKKDVKPQRVEVFQGEDGILVIYVFPLSAEITEADGRVEFEAHIGRIGISQSFDLTQMKFLGKLEL